MIIARALNGGEKCRDTADREINQFGYREIVNDKCPGNEKCPPIDCLWSKWEISENCNGTCLGTDVYRRYSRSVIQQAANGGKECPGGTFKYEKCRDLPPCPRCLNPPCENHECFAPCNCNEYETAFSIPGPPRPAAKSIGGSETAQILANISQINKDFFNLSTAVSSNKDIAAQFNEDGSRCYCHSKCCKESSVTSPPETPPAKLTMIDRLCVMLWKCLTEFIRTESESETTITQEPRLLSAANCCPTLRMTSTNEDTNTYWGPKLGVYQYQSLDKNGSAVYKHTSEKGTYLYRSPLGNWLGGSVVGENKGWIQQTTCDNINCPEECTAGWQYSDGETWKLDASLKPTCGCTPGTRIPSASDSCNTCICNEDGTIGECTKQLCSEDNPLENLIEENIAKFIEGTVRSGRMISDDEHSYNINDIYTNLLLTPEQQQNVRINVVGSQNPYGSENNLGVGKSLVHHAPRPSDNDV